MLRTMLKVLWLINTDVSSNPWKLALFFGRKEPILRLKCVPLFWSFSPMEEI